MSAAESQSLPSPVVCRVGDDCDDLDVRLSKLWLRIGIAGVFAGQGMVFSLAMNMTPPDYGTAAYWTVHGLLIFSSLVVMGFLGGPLFTSTWRMLRTRQLSIEGLFTLSLAGAFIGSVAGSLTGEGDVFYEIVSIVIAIYTFGRMLGERSQAKLQAESSQLREAFDAAMRLDASGQATSVPVAEVARGDVVRVDPGEPFTLDGVVRSGVGFVRETSLTGEPLPVVRRKGDRVRAGTYSEDGSFEVEVAAVFGERELDQILDAVESFSGRPSELQTQANKLVQFFLPVVAAVGVGTAVFWAFAGSWMDAVFNSMAVLLVACPCALGLATPVAIWNGLYRLARMGLVSRDGALIDGLAHGKRIYFDKTGTLSEAEMQLGELLVAPDWEAQRDELWTAVASIESRLKHPVARALAQLLPRQFGQSPAIDELRLIPGAGVEAQVELGGQKVSLRIGEPVAGDGQEAARQELDRNLLMQVGKRVYVAIDGKLAAVAVLSERSRAGVASLWSQLEDLGVRAVVLTGDPQPELEMPTSVPVHAGLSSEEKAVIIRQAVEAGESPCLIGDGINDAAAMSLATSSISMGSGTGLAQSAAMGHFYNDRIGSLPAAIRLARAIHARLKGNLVYAASYNVFGMTLAAMGLLHPVVAALIMMVSSALVTARALRYQA